MSASQSRTGQLFQFLFIFALVYLGTQMTLQYLFPDTYGNKEAPTGVLLQPVDSTVKGQHHPVLTVQNSTDAVLPIVSRCPMPPVLVWKVNADGSKTELSTEETALDCEALEPIAAGATVQIDLAPWKYSLFNEYGTYEVELPVPEGTEVGTVSSGSQYREGVVTRFEVYEPGVFTQLFRTFITKPLLNGLVFIASHTPGYNLGVAILILTIIVKLILFVPTQHAMEGQKKMQAVQPKMDALREKYKNDPQKLQAETMRIWKENGVNPMQSCLPMLIQFPVLIGLFFTIRDGSVLTLSKHLLYAPYENLSWSFGTHFLGMDLTQPNILVMPALLVVMQFVQMKLSFAIQKKKSGSKSAAAMSQQEMQQKVMTYGLPLMIGFFAIKFPAAVALYWATSTAFAIGQQLYVNRKDLR